MLRRTPFKRTMPASQAGSREERLQSRAAAALRNRATRAAVVVASQAAVVSTPKREYVRSKELREAYRLIPCQHCGRDDGTVCCAHSNWGAHGKGGGIKADDSRGASLCSACHVPVLDQGSKLSKAERQDMWWRAHVRSVGLLVKHGLWPHGVAVPDISSPPW